jgi:hypothetical protein
MSVVSIKFKRVPVGKGIKKNETQDEKNFYNKNSLKKYFKENL